MTQVEQAIEKVGTWRSSDHHYSVDGGPWIPGITSIIRAGIDKSNFLLPWGKGLTADAALDNIEKLRAMLDDVGRAPAKAWLMQAADAQSDAAAKLGTQIHDLTEQFDRGQTPDVAPELMPWVEAYHRFLEDWKPVFKSRERYVVNLEQGYAGTYDSICVLGGKLTMMDLKTGKSHYAESRLQLVALGRAEFIGVSGDPKRYPMPAIEQHAILHVRPDAYERGYQLYRLDVNESDWRAFLGALAVYRWSQQRPSKGEPMMKENR